jgi:hypothetical protein
MLSSESRPTRSRAYQNVPHLKHEYQAIAQVLPDIGGTRSAHSGQSMTCGGFIGLEAEATSVPFVDPSESERFRRSPGQAGRKFGRGR